MPKFWTPVESWEIQIATSLSFLLQVILILLGSQRKVTKSKWIKFIVWAAYLSADWVATFALGYLSKIFGYGSQEKYPDIVLQAFWAPFFLLHLGGPDTITAYSSEDNELWVRHLVGLLFQVGVASYVLLKSWYYKHTALSFIAVPVYIAGIIKYGERTWVLWSASTKQFRTSSLLPDEKDAPRMNDNGDIDSLAFLHRSAFFLFERLKALYSGYSLDPRNAESSREIICKLEPSVAFKLVEFELGLLYDVLYTKATLVYTRFGMFLRCITLLALVSALVAFLVIRHELSYSLINISVAYLLLGGAVFLELCALVTVAFSDWTLMGSLLPQKITGCFTCSPINDDKRWSRAISQYNLITFCLQKKRTSLRFMPPKYHHRNVKWEEGVDSELQAVIFNQLIKRISLSPDYLENTASCKQLLNYRGDGVLGEMNFLHQLRWSTVGAEFGDSIFLWHIATELCYYADCQTLDRSTVNGYSKISICLSRYMLYLIFVRPCLLPNETGLRKCNQARNEAKLLLNTNSLTRIDDARKYLLAMKGSEQTQNNNLLVGGSRLADQLQTLRIPENQDNMQEDNKQEGKWKMMNRVWVEILTYAASHCGWDEHGHHLRDGGELLAHVCVLMANLGLCEQYQVSPMLSYQA